MTLKDEWAGMAAPEIRNAMGTATHSEVDELKVEVDKEMARLNGSKEELILAFDGDKIAYMDAVAHAVLVNNLIDFWKSVPF